MKCAGTTRSPTDYRHAESLPHNSLLQYVSIILQLAKRDLARQTPLTKYADPCIIILLHVQYDPEHGDVCQSSSCTGVCTEQSEHVEQSTRAAASEHPCDHISTGLPYQELAEH